MSNKNNDWKNQGYITLDGDEPFNIMEKINIEEFGEEEYERLKAAEKANTKKKKRGKKHE